MFENKEKRIIIFASAAILLTLSLLFLIAYKKSIDSKRATNQSNLETEKIIVPEDFPEEQRFVAPPREINPKEAPITEEELKNVVVPEVSAPNSDEEIQNGSAVPLESQEKILVPEDFPQP